MVYLRLTEPVDVALNESPSEKEGKWATVNKAECMAFYPSMKVPPKRKGNLAARSSVLSLVVPSMKVPPKRKGNSLPEEG